MSTYTHLIIIMRLSPFMDLILLGIIIIALFGSGQTQTCDPELVTVEPISELDISRLMGKTWYVQEIFTREENASFIPEYKNCLVQYIVPYSATAQMVEQYTTDTFNGWLVVYPHLVDGMAVWHVHRSVYPGQERESYTAVFTHTDYKNYGIMHWCPGSASAVYNYERVLTFTIGSPTANETLLGQLQEKVASLGFPVDFRVRIEHHADCDYDVCEARTVPCCDPSVLNAPPMPDLNLNQLLDKRWYVQEIFFREFPLDFHEPSCFVQTLDSFFGATRFTERYTDGNELIISNWSLVTPDGSQAVWKQVGGSSINQHTTVMTHTDYSTFGVMHWCPHPENVDSRAERVLIFTGSPTPDQDLLDDLRGMVESFGFPTNTSTPIRHSDDCIY